ncbi:MAG: hypothetical protein M1814_004219 [Vezdaea aestivalis]|nr:MAG: hypothetical protein M1814_004219 [Vezdaea aestivalis]
MHVFKLIFLLSPVLVAAAPSGLSVVNIPKAPFQLTRLNLHIIPAAKGNPGTAQWDITFKDVDTNTQGSRELDALIDPNNAGSFTATTSEQVSMSFSIQNYKAVNDFSVKLIHKVQDTDGTLVTKAGVISVVPGTAWFGGSATDAKLRGQQRVTITEVTLG